MKPKNIELNLDVSHLRSLIADIGLSQNAIARELSLSTRLFRAYLSNPENRTYKPMPYVVYYALYVWAAYERFKRKERD